MYPVLAEKLWTAEQLADHLQVSVETVWRYTREGKLPAVKLGNHYRYDADEAIAALRRAGEPQASVGTARAPREVPNPPAPTSAADGGAGLPFGRQITYAEFSRLPEQPGLQLIDGLLVKEPSPRYGHQAIIGNLYVMLAEYVRTRGLGEVILAPFDVVLAEDQVLQPDILFIAAERRHIIRDTGVFGAPDLVVEVLSPSSRRYDEGRKREIYLEHGCREMWLIDPDDLTGIFAVRDDDRWRDARLGSGDVWVSPTLGGFRLPLSTLGQALAQR